jgi:hypothetical protein
MTRPPTAALPLAPTQALPVLAPTTIEVAPHADAAREPPSAWRFSVSVVDEANAPGLTISPLAQLDPDDPLTGHELWHSLTDTVMLAGLRESAAATRLLQLLPLGSLNRILMRMAAPGTRSTVAEATLGTVCALSTLACWPERQRQELVASVAEASEIALAGLPADSHGGGTAKALRWMRGLARAYPNDPLALAPLLLQLRFVPARTTYVIPPSWACMHLRGTAIRVVAAETPVVGGGLGASPVDREAFAAALTAGHAGVLTEPSPEALDQADRLATQVAAQHPAAPTTSP